ncbi:hypothetical protein WJ968_18180 [Achromobacter xylosoxidans]
MLVNPTSSYYSSLKTLSAALQARGKRPIVIRDAPGVFETDDILEMVNADLVKITVADRYLANFWKQIFPGIVVREDLTVDAGNDIAFAFRKDSPQLAAALNPFMDAHRGDTTFGKQQFKKYLMSTKWVKHASRSGGPGTLPSPDHAFPALWPGVQHRLAAHGGPGIPGIPAEPERQERGRRDRRDADHARHRQGASGRQHPRRAEQYPRRHQVCTADDRPLLRQRTHDRAEQGPVRLRRL